MFLKYSTLAVALILAFVVYKPAIAAELKDIKDLYHKNIIPGVTPAAEALPKMGAAKSERKNPDGTVSYIFEERKPGFPDEMTVDATKKSVVHLAIAVLDSTECNISDIKKVLGEPDRSGFSLYAFFLRVHIYAQKGMIFITDEKGGLFEKQYIERMPVSDFEKSFGKNFPEKNPYKM